MLRLTDLREILRYVPRFRDRVFVIALDGAVVEDENFRNLLLDVALLRSLNIRVVLVHGAGHQVRRLADAFRITPSNFDGSGVTDDDTLRVALLAANRVSHELLEGLATADLAAPSQRRRRPPGRHPPGRRSPLDRPRRTRGHDPVARPPQKRHRAGHPAGRQRRRGQFLSPQLRQCGRRGRPPRLQAVKLIYLTMFPGIRVRTVAGRPGGGAAAAAVGRSGRRPPEEAPGRPAGVRWQSKLEQGVRAARGGVKQPVHIIDGRVEEGLLAEVFSNEGIGTLIHANEYQAIRRATPRTSARYPGIDAGRRRQRRAGAADAGRDRTADRRLLRLRGGPQPGGVRCMHFYPQGNKAELAGGVRRSAVREPGHRRQADAVRRGPGPHAGERRELFCLSTQAFDCFPGRKGGFGPARADDLPPPPRERYDRGAAVTGAGQEAGVIRNLAVAWARWPRHLREPHPMSHRLLPMAACVLLLTGCRGPEDPAERVVEKLGGRLVRRYDSAKTITEADLSNSQVTDAGLELAALQQLQAVNLTGCHGVTDAGLKDWPPLRG